MKPLFCTLLLLFCLDLAAQQGIGVRFASNLNFFPRAKDYDLVPGPFTTGALGITYSNYQRKSGFDAGLSVNYKNGDDQGFFNLPVVMQDYGPDDNQSVGISSVETHFLVGPRFQALHPRIGYVIGYRWEQTGFFTDSLDAPLNPWYLMLPFGLQVQLPTGYGFVGIGAHYQVGLLNVRNNPNPGTGSQSVYDGGRQHYVSLEINVTFGIQGTELPE